MGAKTEHDLNSVSKYVEIGILFLL